MINDWFLQLARCPVTRSPLVPADTAELERVNRAIHDGLLVNCAQQRIDRPLSGGVLNADRSLLYPVWDHIATLVASDAIALEQLESVDEEGQQPEAMR